VKRHHTRDAWKDCSAGRTWPLPLYGSAPRCKHFIGHASKRHRLEVVEAHQPLHARGMDTSVFGPAWRWPGSLEPTGRPPDLALGHHPTSHRLLTVCHRFLSLSHRQQARRHPENRDGRIIGPKTRVMHCSGAWASCPCRKPKWLQERRSEQHAKEHLQNHRPL